MGDVVDFRRRPARPAPTISAATLALPAIVFGSAVFGLYLAAAITLAETAAATLDAWRPRT